MLYLFAEYAYALQDDIDSCFYTGTYEDEVGEIVDRGPRLDREGILQRIYALSDEGARTWREVPGNRPTIELHPFWIEREITK